jgi:hypothetical protein
MLPLPKKLAIFFSGFLVFSSLFLFLKLTLAAPGDLGRPDDPSSTTDEFDTEDEGTPISEYPEIIDPANYAGFTGQNIILNMIPCAIVGMDLINRPDDTGSCITYNSQGEAAAYAYIPNGGAIGGVSKLMTAMYTPPTSSTQYLADLGSNLGLVSPAYAQSVGGSGEGVIRPILVIWQATRNIAYLGFTFIFLVVGFMIMFRKKLNPQTVITVQQALPGLVIGLILVTFSYFISALIVDLTFILMEFVAYLFQSLGGNIIGELVTTSKTDNLIEISKKIIWNAEHITKLGGGVQTAFQSATKDLPINGAIGGILGGLVLVIVLIGILIQMLRILLALVTAYVTILVITIFSPLIILMASIPGRGNVLSLWWKTLLANILIFPAIFATFLFAGFFIKETNPSNFTQTLPLFQGFSTQVIGLIIGYGAILAAPAIPGMVKSALGVKDMNELSKAGLAGFGAGANIVNGFVGGGLRGGMERAFGPAARAHQAIVEHNRKVEYEQATGEHLGPGGRPIGDPVNPPPNRRFGYWLANKVVGGKK